MKKLLLILVLVVAFYGCSEDNSIPNAVPYTYSTMQDMPGYSWFDEEYTLYNVDQSKVSSILNNFNPATHRIVFFTRPSCSCPGSHRAFPAIYKILETAQIPLEKMEFYSFSSISNKHKYDSLIVVNTLPAFYVFKNGVPVYSLMDTLYVNTYNNVQYPLLYEDLIIEGLKK